MQIYLLRHCESADEMENTYSGIADFPFTEEGRNTAIELGKKLSSSGIEILYHSPYRRAEATAGNLAAMLGLPMIAVYDLRERNSYGVLSGVDKAQAQEIFRHVLTSLVGQPGDYYSGELVVGAEPVEEFDRRVKNAFEEIVKGANEHSVIAIVTHEDVIRSIYKNILGVPGKVNLEVLAITVINYIPMSASIESNEGIQIQVG